MGDDIVAQLRQEAAQCNASPCDCQCPNLIAAADEIERLREINRNLHTECARMQMERDRFRACGNNLHAAAMADRPNDIIGSANWRTLLDNALALWEEARRG